MVVDVRVERCSPSVRFLQSVIGCRIAPVMYQHVVFTSKIKTHYKQRRIFFLKKKKITSC